ncbi:LOW QUALITY PROTEIN: hypothetical protein V2J09_018811 [Rumex salicifolius]
MAQAARLSLRMQKELKLLLSDPPHGASFPFLSAAGDAAHSSSSSSSSSASSLTTIDVGKRSLSPISPSQGFYTQASYLCVEIEGPEGTIYSGGIFKIRIQIPERYPFQPPIVTFATPIYHPNIDNGGRICLDILNLPPKGAWQPSLNVSTVITSIGLLLSEPNPDDGLMCEASREYKYNRQAFDLKARTMTEKFAKTKSSNGIISNSQPPEKNVEHRLTGSKPSEVCEEVSLDLSGSRSEKVDKKKANEVTDPVICNLDFKKKSEPEDGQKLNTNEVHSVGDYNFRKKQKLSLSLLSQPKQSENDHQNSQVDKQVPFYSTPTKIQAVSGTKLQSCEVSNPTSQEKVSDLPENCKRYTGSKKLSLGISVIPRNQDKCKNENITALIKSTGERVDQSKENLPSNSMNSEFAKQGRIRGGNGDSDLNTKKGHVEHILAREVEELCNHGSHNKQQPDPSLTVIVLDSDESDEEDRRRCRSSKPSLLSKRPSWGNTNKNLKL